MIRIQEIISMLETGTAFRMRINGETETFAATVRCGNRAEIARRIHEKFGCFPAVISMRVSKCGGLYITCANVL